jgi:hypothetical protein
MPTPVPRNRRRAGADGDAAAVKRAAGKVETRSCEEAATERHEGTATERHAQALTGTVDRLTSPAKPRDRDVRARLTTVATSVEVFCGPSSSV